MADVHAPGQQGALPGEAQPTGPKILAGPPPGSGVERRVTDEAGEYALPPQGASSNISADASQAAEAAPQPPRVSGADAGAGEAQVQQQPAAVLSSVRTEAARAESLEAKTAVTAQRATSTASAIEDTKVEGRRKVIIRVPKGWYAKEGEELTLGDGSVRVIGEAIGKGCQGGVYNLVDEKGNVDQTRVLKASHRHALMTKVQREWEIGLQIANMFEPDRALPGYMMTGEGVATANGKFVGMILERLQGHSPTKVCKQSSFADVHYLEEFLFCLFNSLDIGQKALGFHHADLRVGNVMEVERHTVDKRELSGKHALQSMNLSDRAASGLDVDPGADGNNGGGVSDSAAERLNRFKIIDYGLADFTEYYPSGHVSVGGPTHAVPKVGPLHLSLGKLQMALPLPISAEQLKRIPQVATLERFYRSFWHNKGDVYHVCWDLTRFLDGRVWPAEDERQVKLLLAMLHHCTGVRLKCWFAPREHVDKDGRLRVKNKFMAFSCVQSYDGWAHILRVRAIRLQAWFRPKNPGITAAEALTAPFFEAAISPNNEVCS